MTWYEILEPAPAPAPSEPPMAAHLVRWWRTKFRNGYKHFSVLAEGERTDTEELMGRASSQCSAPPDLLPSEARALLAPELPTRAASPILQPSSPSPRPVSPSGDKETTHDRLHFEEFTCDVRVRGGEAADGGAQPLHFSFTLYDFDGHGRITKDDIAGIVSTIYESVGKTVTVPHYGSKTIQVRLTVSPEERGGELRERQQVRFKRDLSAHVREGRRKPRRRKPEADTKPENTQLQQRLIEPTETNEEERRSRLSIDDDVSDCSERLRTPKGFKRNMRQRQYQKNNLSPRYRNQQQNNLSHRNDIWNCQKENLLPEGEVVGCGEGEEAARSGGSGGGSGRQPGDKKRSGSLQRRELLEIIQANMEKNHLSFQNSRKQPVEQRSRGVSSLEGDSVNSKHRQRHRSNTFSAKRELPTCPPLTEPVAHGYLDLAGPQHTKDSNLCRYDSFLHAVICSSTQHAKTGFHQKTTNPATQKPWKNHHRSRSHDLEQGPFRYTLLEPYENIAVEAIPEILKNPNADIKTKTFDISREQEVTPRSNLLDGKNKINRSDIKTKSYEIEHNMEALKKGNVNRKASVHVACSPHHMKHQNREKYRARAMAQVEKWLENDNNTRLMKSKKKWSDQEGKISEKVDNLTANLDVNDSVEWKGLLRSSEADAEGAESNSSTVHRYVHEHIHHHYHHFEDNAVVV